VVQEEAARVGYPLLVKAVMGGGGKGMKLAAEPAQFLVRPGRTCWWAGGPLRVTQGQPCLPAGPQPSCVRRPF
jgi:hypothetical protein